MSKISFFGKILLTNPLRSFIIKEIFNRLTSFLRMWRNGRRACLRGKFERVEVRPLSSAPEKKRHPLLVFDKSKKLRFWACFFSVLTLTRSRSHTQNCKNKKQTQNVSLFLFLCKICYFNITFLKSPKRLFFQRFCRGAHNILVVI